MSAAAVRWAHVALNCRDLDATETFYRRWFGFERVRVVDLDPDGGRIVFVRHGEVLLELFAADPPGGVPPVPGDLADGPHQAGTVRHLAFQTDDLADFLDTLDDTVPVALGPLSFDQVIPGWRSVWLVDPDGVAVEVSEGYCDDIDRDRGHDADRSDAHRQEA